MGQFASRVHSKEDGKVYNILPLGDMPTVVFGRVIKENSVPGMQYYFLDGMVKYKDEEQDVGYSYVKPFPLDFGNDDGKWGIPCIFTVPEDLDFSRMSDAEYVRQYSRKAKNLNSNTMSPDFIIREGKIICVRKLNEITPLYMFRKKRYGTRSKKRYVYTLWTDDRGRIDGDTHHMVRKMFKINAYFRWGQSNENHLYASNSGTWSFRNTITLIPFVKRCPRRKSIFHYTFKRIKRKNIYRDTSNSWINWYRVN